MDGVSGAFAVVSLAIQLVDSVQEARTFLKDARNAPNELVRLEEILDQLSFVLQYVRTLLEEQLLTLRLPGTPAFILGALQNCARKMEPLKTLVDEAKVSTGQRRSVQRAWGTTRFAAKKENLRQLERQLSDAKSDLQLAITGNVWQLQMHQLQTTKASVTEATEGHVSDDAPDGTIVSPDDHETDTVLRRPRPHLPTTSQDTYTEWYRGIFGSVEIRKRTKHSSQLPYLRAFGTQPLAEETAITIVPSFMRRLLELRLATSLGKVSRKLNVYPVMAWNSPIFEMCRNGDIGGLQALFSSGEISPFVLDDHGKTLLHYAAKSFNVDLCSWLLGLGVDPDRMADFVGKALHLGSFFASLGSTEAVDTIRMLAQAQDDVSTTDVIECARYYQGPPHGVELILSQQCELEYDPAGGVTSSSAHVFAAALRNSGQGFKVWEPLIRKIIRKGVDIHGRVNLRSIRIRQNTSDSEDLWLDGTPLDELFSDPPFLPSAPSPGGPRALADAWLQILSSEGLDVRAYLREEAAIHAAQHQLTWSYDGVSRQLFFEMGETPSVWWEWCPHPMSPISLVQVEYKQISFDLPEWDIGINDPVSWQDRWPFDHRAWSNDARMWEGEHCSYRYSNGITHGYSWKRTPEWEELDRLANERADRRFAKKVRKAMGAQGRRTRTPMPGSWPE